METIDHDRLFKELLTNFFQEFMEAFFPEASRMLDYNYLEFLTQEIFTDVTAGEKKYIDILVKTRLLGEEGFVLVHVEPQARKEKDFARRMYRYFASLFLRHNMRILPVAILSHRTKKEETKTFEIAFPFHKVLEFNFLQLHLKRLSWKDYLKKDNPVSAALLGCMDFKKEEREQLKLEFFKALLRMKLDPARMQLLIGFLESYVLLTPEQEDRVQQKLAEELPPGEVKKMTEILTSYHKRGMEKGMVKGMEEGMVKGMVKGMEEGMVKGMEEGMVKGMEEGIAALQKTLLKLLRKKMGAISQKTEKAIMETNNIPSLEKALESIFDLDSEETLVNLLNNKQ